MTMDESIASGNGIASSSTARSRRHREKLRQDCTRLDVTVGADVAEKLKAIARQRNVPLWLVIEEAIEMLDAAGSVGKAVPGIA
jgi:hypothetical protein